MTGEGPFETKGDDDTDDQKIIELYCNRSENAIAETAGKYGRYCNAIAYGILQSREDAQECVNDAYLTAWNAIPPRRPADLGTYLGKITRNLSIDRLRTRSREKRGGGETPLALEELEEVVAGSDSPENEAVRKELIASLNRFLGELTAEERYICAPVLVSGLPDRHCGKNRLFGKQGGFHAVPAPGETEKTTD